MQPQGGKGKGKEREKEVLSLVRVVDRLWVKLCILERKDNRKSEFFKEDAALVPWCWVCDSVLSLFSRMSSGTTFPATLSELSLLWKGSSERSFVDPSIVTLQRILSKGEKVLPSFCFSGSVSALSTLGKQTNLLEIKDSKDETIFKVVVLRKHKAFLPPDGQILTVGRQIRLAGFKTLDFGKKIEGPITLLPSNSFAIELKVQEDLDFFSRIFGLDGSSDGSSSQGQSFVGRIVDIRVTHVTVITFINLLSDTRIQYIGQKSLGSLFKIGEGILVHNAKTTSIERVLQEEKGFLVMDNGGSGGLTPAFGEGEEVDEGLEQFGGEESVVFFVNVFGKEEASFLLFSLFGVDDFGGGNSGKVQERNLEDKKNENEKDMSHSKQKIEIKDLVVGMTMVSLFARVFSVERRMTEVIKGRICSYRVVKLYDNDNVIDFILREQSFLGKAKRGDLIFLSGVSALDPSNCPPLSSSSSQKQSIPFSETKRKALVVLESTEKTSFRVVSSMVGWLGSFSSFATPCGFRYASLLDFEQCYDTLADITLPVKLHALLLTSPPVSSHLRSPTSLSFLSKHRQGRKRKRGEIETEEEEEEIEDCECGGFCSLCSQEEKGEEEEVVYEGKAVLCEEGGRYVVVKVVGEFLHAFLVSAPEEIPRKMRRNWVLADSFPLVFSPNKFLVSISPTLNKQPESFGVVEGINLESFCCVPAGEVRAVLPYDCRAFYG